MELLDLSWSWSEKAFAAGALLLLALINVAGVKWVIKVQFLLLLLVLLAALDFIFGSFLDHSDGESGNPLCCESCWTSSFILVVLRVSICQLNHRGMKLLKFQQPTTKVSEFLLMFIKLLEQVSSISTELRPGVVKSWNNFEI